MTTYGQIKTTFTKTLNRKDVTPTQITDWIDMSIQRAQRLLDTPANETIYEATVADGFDKLLLPNDLLRLISVSVDGIELTRTDPTTVRALAKTSGRSTKFCREENAILIGPMPQTGTKIRLVYQSDFSALENDLDENALTILAPDVIVAGAMVQACRYFIDPRGADYENEFVTSISDLNLQAQRDELTNAAISPAYRFDF